MSRARLLFLDAYDSFSNNIVSLLATLLDADVHVLAIDTPLLDPKAPGCHVGLREELRHYDAVICGPGPGSPIVESDVGLMKHIWELDDGHLIPVLGICLGFQSLAVSCGSGINKLSTGLHGMIREIDHGNGDASGADIFEGVPPFKATLYHSLCVDVGQASITEADWKEARWRSPPRMPDMVPLAWVEEPRDGFTERILMGMKHKSKPFWGLQYHPESVCSSTTGHLVIKNWFDQAMAWSTSHGRRADRRPQSLRLGSTRASLLMQSVQCGGDEQESPRRAGVDWISEHAIGCQYVSKTIPLPAPVQVPDVVELLQTEKSNYIVLDSASAHANRIGLDVRGRYSIIALDVDDALRIEYRTGGSCATIRLAESQASGVPGSDTFDLKSPQTIWHLLAEFLDRRRIALPDAESPFLGGFMGYVTYELGLECIDVGVRGDRGHQRPDLCFAWITKSIVIDHLEGTLRVQCLHQSATEGLAWAASVAQQLENSAIWRDGVQQDPISTGDVEKLTPPLTPTSASAGLSPTIQVPDAETYEAKVRKCQDLIAAGDSYELCLTDQTTISQPRLPSELVSSSRSSNSWAPSSATKTPSSWQLYRSLRTRQPAPFGSYIRLGGATLLSSSPERFLQYTGSGLCSMRPMKGTVRKSPAVSTLAQAEAILHVPKEEAENLMIVDLVRHDLHSVCGPGLVRVPQLLVVEEYASVFQMISVVEGQLPQADEGTAPSRAQRYTGLDVLAASLPPGSMTGAPKKRSCEILADIEGHRERSLYSGVVGYMDVAGRGDWSVTIRSLFRWDDEGAGDQDVWHIGAGGAVTALSTAEGERDEMFTKLRGPLGVFQD
jgi:para-aminobenzoate synthetase